MSRKIEKNQKLSKALEVVAANSQFDDEKLIVRNIIGSTGDQDRYGDVVVQSGWELDNYKKNPVILFAHNNYSLPVAKAIDVAVKENRLMFDVQFADNEFSREIYGLLKNGFLNAFSVGFRILEWKYDEKTDGFVILAADLLELSIVPVPANQEAVLERLDKALKTTKGFDVEGSVEDPASDKGEKGTANPPAEEKKEGEHVCEHCQKFMKENFVSKEEAQKMVANAITEQMEAFRSKKVAGEEGAASPSKPSLINALNIREEVRVANKATGKLLKAINQLISSKE